MLCFVQNCLTPLPVQAQELLNRLTKLAGSVAAATALLPLLDLNYAHAATIKEDDLFTERITYPGINGDMQAYIARPKEEKKYASVVVIHENRGLNPHTED